MDQLKVGKDLQKAEDILKRGGLVAIPTETVYGLAANALDIDAIKRVFKAKKRPSYDPLIVHTDALISVERYIEIPEENIFEKLFEQFWPGPLSVIFRKKENGFSDTITAGHPTVAVRVPNHPLTLQLLNNLSFPLVAPSANPFGYVSPVTPEHVYDQLGNEVDYILDGGRTEIGLESTILDLATEPPLIRRKGGVTIEKLLDVIPNLQVADTSSSNPSAPGMLLKHYSTSTPILIAEPEDLDEKLEAKNIGGLFFSRKRKELPNENQIVLSPKGDLEEAAHQLFFAMRTLDKMNLKIILTENFPNHGLGVAINDKIKRACSK